MRRRKRTTAEKIRDLSGNIAKATFFSAIPVGLGEKIVHVHKIGKWRKGYQELLDAAEKAKFKRQFGEYLYNRISKEGPRVANIKGVNIPIDEKRAKMLLDKWVKEYEDIFKQTLEHSRNVPVLKHYGRYLLGLTIASGLAHSLINWRLPKNKRKRTSYMPDPLSTVLLYTIL